MKQNITFGGLTVAPGEKKSGFAPVLDTQKTMPLTVINGAKEGKTVLLTSGIHGGEYPGIACAMELAQQLDPQEVSGQLVIFHPVNYSAFVQRRAYIVPEDGKNLNRQFPGDKEGTISQKMAYVLEHEYIRQADFHIDMHGGDIPEQLAPYAYYAGSDEERARAAAQWLDVRFVVEPSAIAGVYQFAARRPPSLLIEQGGRGLWSREEVEQYQKNVTNVLKHLNVLAGEPVMPAHRPRRITRIESRAARVDGCWYPMVNPEEPVKQGQLLGVIRDVFGNVREEVRAEYDAMILFTAVSLAIAKGEAILTYGC